MFHDRLRISYAEVPFQTQKEVFSMKSILFPLLILSLDWSNVYGQVKPRAVYESVQGFEPPESLTSRAVAVPRHLVKYKRLRPVIEVLQDKYPDRYSAAESVCIPDTRKRVLNSAEAPWSGNCFLRIETSDGMYAGGTGWLIAPNIVLTAGHCVHSGEGGEFFKSVEVIPGFDANSVDLPPFGSRVSTNLRASDNWKSEGDWGADYGAIILESGFGGAKAPATYLPFVLADNELGGLVVNISGYPADLVSGVQYYSGGKITKVTGDRLFYEIDTAGGMSGSAVIWNDPGDERRRVVGIHNYGGCPNKASRITVNVKSDIDAWTSEAK